MYRPHHGLVLALLLGGATPGLAQDEVGRNQVAIDAGMLELGISYARRLGDGPVSIGAGVWGAWEPWNSFDESVLEPLGGELLVRVRASSWSQLELGPSLLRYRWADDCSECTGTFAGVRAAALVGNKTFWFGPTVRYGSLTGSPRGDETGFLFGVQLRLLFSWGE